MRKLLGVCAIVAASYLGCGQAICADDTVMWPDASGKMVRIPIAHTYEQCRKNGRNLGYSDGDTHAWCTQHCNGTICQ
jgi:hypothetical protein